MVDNFTCTFKFTLLSARHIVLYYVLSCESTLLEKCLACGHATFGVALLMVHSILVEFGNLMLNFVPPGNALI